MFPGGLGISRKIDRAVTVLPEPDSPTRPRISPRRSEKETPSTAFRTPLRVKKWVFSPSTRSPDYTPVAGSCRASSRRLANSVLDHEGEGAVTALEQEELPFRSGVGDDEAERDPLAGLDHPIIEGEAVIRLADVLVHDEHVGGERPAGLGRLAEGEAVAERSGRVRELAEREVENWPPS